MGSEYSESPFSIFGSQSDNKAYAHVEYIVHLPVRNLSPFFESLEHWEYFPTALFYFDGLPRLEDTRYVFIETASGYMADSMHVHFREQVEHGLHVYLRRGKKHFADSLSAVPERRAESYAVIGNYFPDKAETIGMHPCRCHAYEHVSSRDLAPVNQPGFFHDPAGKTGYVVFTVPVHSRHLGRLPSYQGAACLTAAFGNTGDYGLDFLRDIVPYSHIIKEKQGLRTLGENIVHAHRHGIYAYGIVPVHFECEFQLGSHAVGPAHEHRFLETEGRKVEHAPERAYAAHHSRPCRTFDMTFYAAYHFISGFKINTGFFIYFGHNRI